VSTDLTRNEDAEEQQVDFLKQIGTGRNKRIVTKKMIRKNYEGISKSFRTESITK
jgi:hypothetical protein